MNLLLVLAVVLLGLWVVAEMLGFVIGAALHLLWIAAVVLFVIGLVQRIGGAF